MEFISDIAELRDFPGYGVDRHGNVYILDTPSGVPWVLPQKPRANNMRTVVICIGGNRYEPYVHDLVAEAFILKRDGYDFVNHINGVNYDNRVDNLRWSQKSEIHITDPSRRRIAKPCKIRNSLTGEIFHFKSEMEVAEFLDATQGAISSALSKGHRHRIKGFDIIPEDEEFIFYEELSLEPRIIATNMVTGEILSFPSAYRAAKELGLDESNLSKALRGKRSNIVNGWRVEHIEDGFGLSPVYICCDDIEPQ